MAYIVLVTMFFLLNLLSALSLIFIERKAPTTTWAWLIILIVLPGIGLILYLLDVYKRQHLLTGDRRCKFD